MSKSLKLVLSISLLATIAAAGLIYDYIGRTRISNSYDVGVLSATPDPFADAFFTVPDQKSRKTIELKWTLDYSSTTPPSVDEAYICLQGFDVKGEIIIPRESHEPCNMGAKLSSVHISFEKSKVYIDRKWGKYFPENPSAYKLVISLVDSRQFNMIDKPVIPIAQRKSNMFTVK